MVRYADRNFSVIQLGKSECVFGNFDLDGFLFLKEICNVVSDFIRPIFGFLFYDPVRASVIGDLGDRGDAFFFYE